MRTSRLPSLLLAVLAVLALAAGCAGGSSDASSTTAADGAGATTAPSVESTTTGKPVKGEIRVLAAASLTDSFTQLGQLFQQANPDAKVVFDFGPSSRLADTIIDGAPADVFASADTKVMDELVSSGNVGEGVPALFVRNQPELAVPVGNPGKVKGLGDLAKGKLAVGLCAAEVPCGAFARAVLKKAGVKPSIDTNEPDVKALLAKITSGDLDVGIVYHSDVVSAAGQVEGIEIPAADNVTAEYPIARLIDAKNRAGAQAFVDFVGTPDAQRVLSEYGFVSIG